MTSLHYLNVFFSPGTLSRQDVELEQRHRATATIMEVRAQVRELWRCVHTHSHDLYQRQEEEDEEQKEPSMHQEDRTLQTETMEASTTEHTEVRWPLVERWKVSMLAEMAMIPISLLASVLHLRAPGLILHSPCS